MKNSIYYTAQEVAQMLGISRGHAYKIVKNLNVELQQQGYITIAGRVPKKYLREHYYGLTVDQETEMLAN